MRIVSAKFIIGILIASNILLVLSVYLLTQPTSTSRESFLKEGTAILGTKNAAIYLVEFSDFQCPACKFYKPTVDSILQKYGDKLIFGYRHFPLPQHPFGQLAAEAAEAAGEQGKFWQMYEYLFANQEKLSEDFIKRSGKEIGLDMAKFQSAINSGKFKNKVMEDLSDGKSFGVNATPTFFLNGNKVNMQSPTDLEKAVEEAI